ncbi:TauD/TfdA family dioxygenase [Burkholderia contaminans]|uniref:TauD/TfdA family dioxygenase n=1 Tax=Burkholderia contaminans TaxID=488447 RepID=UPI0021F272E3|nr:TauD/TfdA family dioxygenase [Burkholderia contaminans]
MTERKLLAEGSSPWLLEPVSNGRDLAQAVNDNRAALESRLLEHGALLFRGFDVSSVGGFEAFAHAISAISPTTSIVPRHAPRSATASSPRPSIRRARRSPFIAKTRINEAGR